ncbi:MAG: glycosyltransferase [Deltaproteobacteria bacterium]|nr:glycosyltransferase [Deltaproteobacteria bacterium]
MKLVVVASSLDLGTRFGCVPAWWQLLKGLYEIGVEVIASPYQGPPVESLWWRAAPNPCWTHARLFELARGAGRAVLRRLPGTLAPTTRGDRPAAGETATERATRAAVRRIVLPRWERHLSEILESEGDVDAILVLGVPLNHLTGLPQALRRRFGRVTLAYYDGDVPASLPQFRGFASGFRIYSGAEPDEWDLFLSNSSGGVPFLEEIGARNVRVLPYAADPDVYRPVPVAQDVDAFFYGFGAEYREDWLRRMVAEPSRALPGARFAGRVTGMDGVDLGRLEQVPYASFSRLREHCCRARLNLCVTRGAHASVPGSSSMRPFELAALGCCIVSNPYAGIEEWFAPGSELVVVDEQADVAQVYRELLADEPRRRAMGAAARARVLAQHTFRHRAEALRGWLDASRGT